MRECGKKGASKKREGAQWKRARNTKGALWKNARGRRDGGAKEARGRRDRGGGRRDTYRHLESLKVLII